MKGLLWHIHVRLMKCRSASAPRIPNKVCHLETLPWVIFPPFDFLHVPPSWRHASFVTMMSNVLCRLLASPPRSLHLDRHIYQYPNRHSLEDLPTEHDVRLSVPPSLRLQLSSFYTKLA